MIGLLKNIFSSAKNTTKIIDAVINTGDKLFFTDEEKSEVNKQYRDWYLKYLETTQPQNLARRLCAVMVVFLWVILVITAAVTNYFDETKAAFILSLISDNVNTPFVTILFFYFGGHAVQKFTNKK